MAIKCLDPEEGYDRASEEYGRYEKSLEDFDGKAFFALLPSITDASVIDLGSGTGRITVELMKRYAHVTAVDASPKMLTLLQKRVKAVKSNSLLTSVVDDICLLSTQEDEQYDLAVTSLTICHIADIAEAFENWYRILKPSGKLIICHNIQRREFTFGHGKDAFKIQTYFHRIEEIFATLQKQAFRITLYKDHQHKGETLSYWIVAQK